MKRKIKKAINEPKAIFPYFKTKFWLLPYWTSKGGYSFLPRRIAIAVNSICNLRCVMCDIGERREDLQFYKNIEDKKTLSVEMFKKLIDEVRYFRPFIVINLTEPLLHKDILFFVRYLSKQGLNYQITTNGYLLEKFATKFVEDKVPLIYVSIDGPPEVHNKVRGVADSFQKAYNGIQRLIQTKKELNQILPRTCVAYTISNYNSHCLNETASIFKELGVETIIFGHLNFITEEMAKAHNDQFGHICKVSPSSISTLNPKRVNIKALMEQIRLLKKNYPKTFINFLPDIATFHEINTYYKNPEKFVLRRKCTIPWRNAQILANGDVVPASRCFHVVMGNIYQNSFVKIWNSKIIRNFRKELKEIGTTPACSRCCGILG